jgi:hypothetical protein
MLCGDMKIFPQDSNRCSRRLGESTDLSLYLKLDSWITAPPEIKVALLDSDLTPIPSSIARPLLYFLTVHLDFMTVLTYMQGIKITTNILTKKLVIASSLIGVNRKTN